MSGILLADWSVSLQFRWTVRNIVSSLTSLKASLRTNLYTKKQINFQFVKSENNPIPCDSAVCPAMSKYVRLCPNFLPKFLTFQLRFFYSRSLIGLVCDTVCRFFLGLFSSVVRICAIIFVNLWKHYGNITPPRRWNHGNHAIGTSPGSPDTDTTVFHNRKGCSHEHCKLCFPAHESKIVPRKTLAM